MLLQTVPLHKDKEITKESLKMQASNHGIIFSLSKIFTYQFYFAIQKIKIILRQCHLIPFSMKMKHIYWPLDYTLRLYPTPDVLILAASNEMWKSQLDDCLCINPKPFAHGWGYYQPNINEYMSKEHGED